MNPALRKAIEDGLALLPVNIPDKVALVLASALTQTIEALVKRHLADPEFGAKLDAWHAQHEAAKGGSDDAKAQASAALMSLMGS